MDKTMSNTLVKRLISGILTCMLMFTLIPDTRAIASEVQNNKAAVVETVQEDTAKQADKEPEEADAKKAESNGEGKAAAAESEEPEASDDREGDDADSAAKDEVAQLEVSLYADPDFKEQIAADKYSGSVTLKGRFAKDVQARAWVEKEKNDEAAKDAEATNTFISPNGDVLSQVVAYGIEFWAGENAWLPNEAFEVKLVDDDLKTALREGKQFTVIRLNDKDKTAVECPILVNEEEGDIDSLRFVTEEPGVFLVCAPSDPKAEEGAEPEADKKDEPKVVPSAEPEADDTVEEPKAEASSDDTSSADTKADASDSAKEDAKEEVKEAAKEDEKKSDDKDAKKSEEKDTKAPKEKDADKDTSEDESAKKDVDEDKIEKESADQDKSAEKDADKDESSKGSEDKDAKKSDTAKEDAESKDKEQAQESSKSEQDESDAAKKVVAVKKSNRKAAALMAGSDEFVPINSNAEITNALGNTKFPVYYAFANGQIVSGDAIGVATELTSGRLYNSNDIVLAGADITSFQRDWRSALGITTGNVTLGLAYLNNSTLIRLAFKHSNGNVYHAYTNYNATSDALTTAMRNEINRYEYMLLGNDKIVVRLTLADNAASRYKADGITYGTITNSTVRATATVLNADEHGSDNLPATVVIAGVPYTVVDNVTSFTKDSVTYTIDRSKKEATVTSLNADEHGSDDLPKRITIAGTQYTVVDNITSYTKNGVTYELDRKSKTVTSHTGPSFENLTAANNGITVNGVQFTYGLTGTVTYKGIEYTIDTSKTDGQTAARVSGYRAATIGDGTVREETAVVEYGKTTTPAAVKSVTTSIPIEKKLTSNETADNTLAALKNDKFTFTIAQDTSNPVGGAQVALASDSSADSTEVTITAKRLLKDADKSTSQAEVTYTLKGDDAPWKVTFTKPGTYKFVIHEEDTGTDGVTYDAADKTVTYHVLEEEGSLRLAQNNRESSDPILANKVTDVSVEALSLDHLFNTAYALGNATRIPPTITQEGSKIVMDLNQDTSGVITTAFTFDFSRSFEVRGKLGTPDSDAVALALHGEESLNAYRWDCNNGIDNFHFGNGSETNQFRILRYGYIPPNTDLVKGFLLNVMTRDLEHMWGWYAYKVENNVRMPYVASSGLNGDVTRRNRNLEPDAKSYETFDNDYERPYKNNWDNEGSDKGSDFLLRFVCRDSTRGAGTLTMVVMGKTIEFNNFVASDIIGEDEWQDAHFSIGASVQNGDKGGLEFDTVRYLNEAVKSVTTSFWADRDKDGAYETQVNTTNSLAVPGESILVRHTIAREDETSDYFYERALVRQLIDVTADNKKIVPSDLTSAVTYPQGDMSKAVRAQNVSKQSFNSDKVVNGMKIKVFANTTTNFEYKITAPAEGGHTVAESALFGQPPFNNIQTDSYGFKTELLTEQLPSFTNTAEVYPVCKIVDGSKTNIFFSLKDAVDFADDSDNGLTNKNVTIQMLVPSHTIGEAITAAHGSNKITITTASTSDSTYPYRGEAGTQATLVRGFSGDSVITSTSSLELNDITMDGSSDSYTSGLAGGLVKMNGSATPTLTLSGDTKLMNSALDNDDNAVGGGAIYLDDNCSLAMVDQATIENCISSANGGAIATGKSATVELSNNATIQSCEAQGLGGAIFTDSDTTLRVRGNALLGDDNTSDNVDKGNKAWGTSETSGRGGAIHAEKSTVVLSGNAKIAGNYAQNGGGGINYAGDTKRGLIVSNDATIAYNTSDADGGGIRAATTGTVDLQGGSLSQNVAQNNGGGAYFDGAQEVNIASGFALTKNEATDGDGGAIYASTCKIDMETGAVIGGDSDASANRAKNGGGIAMEGGVTLHSPGGIMVSHNVATANGGGIYVKTDDVTNSLQLASGDAVQYNTAVNGGGMYIVGDNNKVTLNGASDGAVTVSANTATTSGGGAYVESGTLSLYGNSGVQFNVAGTNAGGVYLGTNGTLNVSDAASVSENAVGDAQSNVSSNVYLPGEGNGSKAGGVIMVGGELTGTIGVFAEHADHDGLAVATNEQFAQTDSKNTTYKTDFNKVFKNDRNGEAKAVISKTDDKDIEWEADAVNLTITESTEGEYADLEREFELTLTSDELKGTTVETEADGAAGTLAFDESGKATIKLAHDKSVVLKGLKKATSLTVVSEDVAGYATTYDVAVGESTNADLQQCAVTMSNEASVIVHNEFDGVPATGLSDSANAWLCAIAISAILFVASWLHRRRHAA